MKQISVFALLLLIVFTVVGCTTMENGQTKPFVHSVWDGLVAADQWLQDHLW